MFDDVNLTELVELCRTSGIGNVSRATPRAKLIEALENDTRIPADALQEKREMMENHVQKNYRRLRTQLPNCTGKCVSFGCPNVIVARCWRGMKDDMF